MYFNSDFSEMFSYVSNTEIIPGEAGAYCNIAINISRNRWCEALTIPQLKVIQIETLNKKCIPQPL